MEAVADGRIVDFQDSVCDSSNGYTTFFKTPERHPFFYKMGWCPYCQAPTQVKYHESGSYVPVGNDDPCLDEYFSATVWYCSACGWWDMNASENSGHDSVDPSYGTETVRHAVLKSFDISDAEIPVQTLRNALIKRSSSIHHIHHEAMENLVAAVLSDFYPNCEACVCGGVADGGIDVILILADEPIAIQVKRRYNPESQETVSAVREFFGACIAQGFEKLVYVSTADHFTRGSQGAKQFAREVVNDRIVESFELINRDRFLGMLRESRHLIQEPWTQYLPARLKN